MTDKDPRPLYTPAPDWTQALVRPSVEKQRALLNSIWADAVAATPPDAQHAFNDHLSLLLHVVGCGVVDAACRLAERKEVAHELALEIVVSEIYVRVLRSLPTEATHGHA